MGDSRRVRRRSDSRPDAVPLSLSLSLSLSPTKGEDDRGVEVPDRPPAGEENLADA